MLVACLSTSIVHPCGVATNSNQSAVNLLSDRRLIRYTLLPECIHIRTAYPALSITLPATADRSWTDASGEARSNPAGPDNAVTTAFRTQLLYDLVPRLAVACIGAGIKGRHLRLVTGMALGTEYAEHCRAGQCAEKGVIIKHDAHSVTWGCTRVCSNISHDIGLSPMLLSDIDCHAAKHPSSAIHSRVPRAAEKRRTGQACIQIMAAYAGLRPVRPLLPCEQAGERPGCGLPYR